MTEYILWLISLFLPILAIFARLPKRFSKVVLVSLVIAIPCNCFVLYMNRYTATYQAIDLIGYNKLGGDLCFDGIKSYNSLPKWERHFVDRGILEACEEISARK